ncbi:hypothetical protein [Saccharibacillus brassicae]|uniref:Uncharacterized protein n=1 Tax=Saccharibacillus brassicae TaxID=2583377 RepID=A0A4Y6V0B7_SACBS|nr:hypothetical protein [Saccharibacillus brassicae]QDH23492.1 hypothetical protein FFV09_23070 [Saccharibacillus brassicae]
MPNAKGWLDREEVLATRKPVLVPGDHSHGEWKGKRPENCLLLPKSRCAEYGCPVEPGELPAAYGYTSKPNDLYRYIPFYARYPGMLDYEALDAEYLRQLERIISHEHESHAS